MAEHYADKQFKLFSLSSNVEIAQKLRTKLESLLEKCQHASFQTAKS